RISGPAGVAGDQDVIGLALGDARSDGADADFAHQLHAHPRLGVYVLEVVDELSEVLDGIDVVMRRRRDQADAGRAVTDLADVFIDLVAGKRAAFARLGALRHLDLKLVGVDEIFDRHAEAPGGDLLDRAATEDFVAVRVGLRIGLEPPRVFAAFARVRFP